MSSAAIKGLVEGGALPTREDLVAKARDLIPLLRQSSGWTGLVWCATVSVSYIVWHEPQWIVPKWAALVEYVPVYLALTIELAWIARRYSFTYSTSSPIFVNPT